MVQRSVGVLGGAKAYVVRSHRLDVVRHGWNPRSLHGRGPDKASGSPAHDRGVDTLPASISPTRCIAHDDPLTPALPCGNEGSPRPCASTLPDRSVWVRGLW